jgi:hypothetical protein
MLSIQEFVKKLKFLMFTNDRGMIELSFSEDVYRQCNSQLAKSQQQVVDMSSARLILILCYYDPQKGQKRFVGSLSETEIDDQRKREISAINIISYHISNVELLDTKKHTIEGVEDLRSYHMSELGVNIISHVRVGRYLL